MPQFANHPSVPARIGRLLVFALASLSVGPATAADRPDIVLMIADDQTWSDSGVYGNPDVKTPNIDALAAQGMRFTHAFTATAMCAPTRQQLYTGLFPVRNGAYPNHSRVYEGTKSIVHYLRALGYRAGLAGKKHFGPAESFPFEHIGGNKAYRRIERFINRDRDEPYLLVVASHSPHLPWSEGDASRYDPAELTLPPYLADTPAMRERLRRYYAEITDFDAEVGRVMQIVREAGRAESTIFIYTSEQGAQMPHGKWTCYDTGLRTALVVRWPAKVKAGAVTDAMVQYVDVAPTLLAAADGEGVAGLDGRSFLPVLLGQKQEHRDVVFGVHTTRGIIDGSPNYPIRSIRTRTHKLIWNLNHEAPFRNIVTSSRDRGGYWESWVKKAKMDDHAAKLVRMYQHRPEFELYDLRTDPHELSNVADDPAHANLIASLHERLRAWMKQQGDEGVATELKARDRQGRGNEDD